MEFIESWGSCVSQSHDDRPHTPWLRRSQHVRPDSHVIVRMSQQLITRTSYIQCPKRESFEIRDTFTNSSQVSDVHPCMRNRTHAPTAKSARPATRFAPATRYIGPQHNPGAKVDTFVRDACKCSLRRDACFESTSRPANARREHTAAGNAPQHPPSTGAECLPLPSRSSRSRQSSIMLVRKEDPMQEGFVRKRTQAVPKL